MTKKKFAAAQAVELYIGNYRFDAITYGGRLRHRQRKAPEAIDRS